MAEDARWMRMRTGFFNPAQPSPTEQLMTTQIILLRAVNVAGRGMISMSDLRQIMSDLSFQNVRTLLQSGNVVFRTNSPAGAKLEAVVQTELERQLKLRTDVFVRSARQWADLIAANPFADEALRDPGHLLAIISKRKPAQDTVAALRAAAAALGPELVRECGGQVYITYPAGIGRSRLTTALIERTLGVRVTGRNWNTVLKLAQLADDIAVS